MGGLQSLECGIGLRLRVVARLHRRECRKSRITLGNRGVTLGTRLVSLDERGLDDFRSSAGTGGRSNLVRDAVHCWYCWRV